MVIVAPLAVLLLPAFLPAASATGPLCPGPIAGVVNVCFHDFRNAIGLVSAPQSVSHSITVELWRYSFPIPGGSALLPCVVVLVNNPPPTAGPEDTRIDPCGGGGGTPNLLLATQGPFTATRPDPFMPSAPVLFLVQADLDATIGGFGFVNLDVVLLCDAADCTPFP